MNINNRTNHHTKQHIWPPGFKVETQFGKKTTTAVISVFNIYCGENFLQYMLVQTYTSMQAPTCRRLQPSLVYQCLLEGSYYPLLSFTSYHWKGATTPFLKASTLSTTADHVSSTFICDIPCRSPDLFIFCILTPVLHDFFRHSHQRFIIIFMGAS